MFWECVEEIKSNLPGLKTGKHIIFYKVITQQEIEIIRILH
jgi:toxin ParE1/3/4